MVCLFSLLIKLTFCFFVISESYLTTSQTIENLPVLDLEVHYIDPITSTDPEVQKVVPIIDCFFLI